jgi:hypothetical protein
MMLSFGSWEPDKAGLDSQLVAVAKGVFPAANSKKPKPSYIPFGSAAFGATCRGMAFGKEDSGTWLIFGGTSTALKKFVSGSWADYTRTTGTYSLPSGDYWSFAQFGSKLIAAQLGDVPQVLDLATGDTAFTPLAGSPPKARIVKSIGPFVFLCGIDGAPRTVKWSGIENCETWTVDPTTTLSDEQQFPTGGRVMNIHGGKTGFVLLEHSVQQYAFNPGSTYVFEFQEVEGARGATGPYSSAALGPKVFFHSETGFVSMGPDGLNPIGAQRVDQWFRDNSDPARVGQMICHADPYNPRIHWFFYTSEGSDTLDGEIYYDWQLDQWGYDEVAGQYFAPIAPPGTTLEQLDSYGTLETLEASLDARIWQGGKPTMACIADDQVINFASGPNVAATLETVEAHLAGGQRAFASRAYPLVNAPGQTLTFGARETLQSDVSWSDEVSLERTGHFSLRSSSRLHRFRLTIPAGTAWDHAQGLNVDAQPDGDA